MFGCQPHIKPLLWPTFSYKLLHHKLILKARSVQKPWSSAICTLMSSLIEIKGLLRRHLLVKMVWSSWQQIPPQQKCSCTEKKRQDTHNEPTGFFGIQVLDSQTTGLRPKAVPHFQCPSETWCECCLFETSDSKREMTERERREYDTPKGEKNIHPDRSSHVENHTYKLKVPYYTHF